MKAVRCLALFVCLLPSIWAQDQTAWIPPQELLDGKTLYVELLEPKNEELAKCNREHLSRLSAKMQKWCSSGKWCWKLAAHREDAGLILRYEFVRNRSHPGKWEEFEFNIIEQTAPYCYNWWGRPYYQKNRIHSPENKLLYEDSREETKSLEHLGKLLQKHAGSRK